MNVFIRAAIGEVDMSRVVLQVGQTISASRSACRGGLAATADPASAEPPSASAARTCREEPDHCAWPSAAWTPLA